MPSTVPVVKPGLRDWMRTLVGLRPTDGVYVSGVAVDPENVTTNTVMLAGVLAPQTAPVMSPDLREETASLTGYCLGFAAGSGDAAEDAARNAAYAMLAVLEQAIKTDPSAGGVIPGPLKATLAEGGLTNESPGTGPGGADRRAMVAWRLLWGSDI